MVRLVYLLKKRKEREKTEGDRPRGEYQRGGDQQRSGRPQRNRSFNRDNRGGGNDRAPKETFEQKMARFLKDSEDRFTTSLKRNTESKTWWPWRTSRIIRTFNS